MSKRIALVGTMLLCAATLVGCGGNSSGSNGVASGCKPAHTGLKTVTSGKLTTSTYNFPPFIALKGTQVGGAEGAVLSQIASMECMSLTGLPLDTGSVVSAAQNGRADIASGNWYCTAARATIVNLAGPVYGDQIGIISADGASTFDEIKGRVVGTVDGYLWNNEFQKIFGQSLKVYPTPTAMYTDLKAGRIKAAADSYGSATYANKQNGGNWKVVIPKADSQVAASKAPPQVCFPMPKKNEALYNAINDDIQTLRKNGKLGQLLQKNGLSASAADAGPLKLIK
ncbi:transporter substrate-binding domain-containing protein [Streptomyces sp. NPDC005708]|uniref:substrate-binding periplasmic protein n=1 Tax=Streptomyces sp. NPDC005708 TaxID=3154564 RepID=UPI0033F58768